MTQAETDEVTDDADSASPASADGAGWSAWVDGAVLVERAKGIVMQLQGCGAVDAEEELSRRALDRGESVIEVAYQVVIEGSG